ncbi:MAG: DUF4418 family protein [Spirochaetales bacterium]|nr:DUF4418 family protein [Spirochaetales bacterium]
MKNRILSGTAVIIAGLLICLGPQFLFKVCGPALSHNGGGPVWMKCHWSAQAEIGIGALLAAFGLALLLSGSRDIRTGLSAGVFLSAILALLIPHGLIGGCPMATMPCRAISFPSITVLGILLLIISAGNILYLARTRS